MVSSPSSRPWCHPLACSLRKAGQCDFLIQQRTRFEPQESHGAFETLESFSICLLFCRWAHRHECHACTYQQWREFHHWDVTVSPWTSLTRRSTRLLLKYVCEPNLLGQSLSFANRAALLIDLKSFYFCSWSILLQQKASFAYFGTFLSRRRYWYCLACTLQ